jgi:TIR domain/Pentapeptide repeats (8 copies)
MADSKLVAILKQGSKAWNAWRREKVNSKNIVHEAALDHIDPYVLGGSDLRGVNLRDLDLSYSDLSALNIAQSDLRGANLIGASFQRTDLTEAQLERSCFHAAKLFGATLLRSNLSHADMSAADLRAANLRYAILHKTNLEEANLGGAEFKGTIFADIDLSKTSGLNACFHLGASFIDVLTLYRSQGRHAEAFLLASGVPDQFISFSRSLSKTEIPFYSAFISYDERDEEFAFRISVDLRAKGIRCWLSPGALEKRETFQIELDESLGTYDKLIVIISQYSLESEWLRAEVAAAFSAIKLPYRGMLSPIWLDEDSWKASVVSGRYTGDVTKVGDFRLWRDNDVYRKAISLLVKDFTLALAEKSHSRRLFS